MRQAGGYWASADPLEEPGQVGCGELPVERLGAVVVPVDEGQQGSGELGRGGEVVGREDLFCTMARGDCPQLTARTLPK